MSLLTSHIARICISETANNNMKSLFEQRAKEYDLDKEEYNQVAQVLMAWLLEDLETREQRGSNESSLLRY